MTTSKSLAKQPRTSTPTATPTFFSSLPRPVVHNNHNIVLHYIFYYMYTCVLSRQSRIIRYVIVYDAYLCIYTHILAPYSILLYMAFVFWSSSGGSSVQGYRSVLFLGYCFSPSCCCCCSSSSSSSALWRLLVVAYVLMALIIGSAADGSRQLYAISAAFGMYSSAYCTLLLCTLL